METKKVAVITGGADGIGADITRRMVRDGLAVAILDCNTEKASALADELRTQGGEAVAIYCDATNPAEVSTAFDNVIDIYGKIDVLAHNVGYEEQLPWMEASFERWRNLFAVNCDSLFLCVHRAAVEMVKAEIKGKIIMTLSQASYTQDSDAVLYCATKWGGRGFMRNAALALAPYGITVNGVCPGTVWTAAIEKRCDEFVDSGEGSKAQFIKSMEDKYPLKRMQTGEDIAAMYSFLIREGHCISGQSILVAGGRAFA